MAHRAWKFFARSGAGTAAVVVGNFAFRHHSCATLCSDRRSTQASEMSPSIGGPVWPTLQRPVPHGSTRLLLIRHGETKWNAEKRMQGQLDIELNDSGREQARCAKDALGQNSSLVKGIDAVVSSDLLRASETADLIAACCPHAQRQLDPRMREFHFGQLQGKLAAEIKDVYGPIQAQWKNGDLRIAVPGGESAHDIITRGRSSLQDAANLGSLVVVVAHGGLIRWSLAGIEFDENLSVQECMSSQRVRSVLDAHVGNCCCSVVLFDHATRSFLGEHYFASLAAGETLDDTG